MATNYIDRNALIEHIRKDPLFDLVEQYGITGVIESFPTADVKPVGHAKWIETTEDAEYDCGYRHIRKLKCSCCGYCQSKSNIADSGALLKSRYCPVCGARMDLEDDNA